MSEVLAEQKIPLEMDKYLKLLPHKHQTDGFFAAVLQRKALAKPAKAEARADSADSVDATDANNADNAE
jgi:16S rRNA (cytosine967-C5)-methyltransferase